MPGARQPPGEANSGFTLCKHAAAVLEAWTHAGVHWCDCSRPVVSTVTLSSRHTPTCHRCNHEGAKHCGEKLGDAKSPEKAFFSSWVTRVQVAPSRLINSSNGPWIFNTYRWNGAPTLAALFHIMRTLPIAKLWLKHDFLSRFTFNFRIIVWLIWDCLRVAGQNFIFSLWEQGPVSRASTIISVFEPNGPIFLKDFYFM